MLTIRSIRMLVACHLLRLVGEPFCIWVVLFNLWPNIYRERLKGVHILLSNSQEGPGRTGKQEQDKISSNHIPSV